MVDSFASLFNCNFSVDGSKYPQTILKLSFGTTIVAAYVNKTFICLFVSKNMEMFIGSILNIRFLMKLMMMIIDLISISSLVNENTTTLLFEVTKDGFTKKKKKKKKKKKNTFRNVIFVCLFVCKPVLGDLKSESKIVWEKLSALLNAAHK